MPDGDRVEGPGPIDARRRHGLPRLFKRATAGGRSAGRQHGDLRVPIHLTRTRRQELHVLLPEVSRRSRLQRGTTQQAGRASCASADLA
jgi:hypothetical protein